jgi:hypothetical protein
MKYFLILMLVCITECSAAAHPGFLLNDLATTNVKSAHPNSMFDYSPYSGAGHRGGNMNAGTVAAYILAYSGGFMVGYTLGTAIAGGDPNWGVAGIGAGLIVVAVPLSIIGKRHSDSYAAGPAIDRSKRPRLYIVTGPTNVGLQLLF